MELLRHLAVVDYVFRLNELEFEVIMEGSFDAGVDVGGEAVSDAVEEHGEEAQTVAQVGVLH